MNVFLIWVKAMWTRYAKRTMASQDNSELSVPIITTNMPEISPNPPIAPTSPIAPSTPLFAPMILKWADAIAPEEGAKPGSNNPGNMKYTTLTKSWGATQGRPATDGGYLCQFATMEAGKDALLNFLTLGCEGELIISHPWPCTFQDFTKRYAGDPPQAYIDQIATAIDVSTNVLIKTFLVS